jgi:L-2-hydroxyglutarate oxidase LhgO
MLSGAKPSVVSYRMLINTSGLYAIELATRIEIFLKYGTPKVCFAKGNYFSYMCKVSFSHLIYPASKTGGLGAHLNLELKGQAYFGPDVEWVEKLDYQVNKNLKFKFARAIQTHWPSRQQDQLMPSFSGIRPKLGTPQEFLSDFYIQPEIDHGVPGFVNFFGIESAGLTVSLVIAEVVSSIFQKVSH